MNRDHPLRWLRLWTTIAWLLVGALVYASLMPAPPDLDLRGGDKMAHIAAYAAVTLWFVQIYAQARARLVVASGLVALGVLLEGLQSLTGYRSLELADMAANTAGVALGWLSAPPRTPNLLLHIERRFAR